jgi:hypothetical protein
MRAKLDSANELTLPLRAAIRVAILDMDRLGPEFEEEEP